MIDLGDGLPHLTNDIFDDMFLFFWLYMTISFSFFRVIVFLDVRLDR